MRVIKPNPMQDSALISTTAVETVAVWAAGTSYTVGQLVRRDTTHRIYENLIAGVDAVLPEVASVSKIPRWLDLKPTNIWAMFDVQVNTSTTAPTPLVVTTATGLTTSFALFNVTNAKTALVEMRNGISGPVVFSKLTTLETVSIDSWFDYFFADFIPQPDLVVDGLPLFNNAYMTVTITGLPGSTIGCGNMVSGVSFDIGATQYGATAGIIDYSRKDTDDFGNVTFTKRAFSKRVSARLIVPNERMNKVQQILASLRATPCAWLGSDVQGFESLSVYGYYKDFSIDVQYHKTSQLSIEIEGLT